MISKLVYNLTITKVYGGYIELVECVKVSQLKTEGPFMLGHINYIYIYNVIGYELSQTIQNMEAGRKWYMYVW